MKNRTSDEVLNLLAKRFPDDQSLYTEIINLKAILNLPKGTEHFMSDLHGEYEAFCHILNNCSGVIREKTEKEFAGEMTEEERDDFLTLIYYPEEKLAMELELGHVTPAFYEKNLYRLIRLSRSLSSRYTRSKVRKAMPPQYAYVLDELLHAQPDEDNNQFVYHQKILETLIELGSADEFIEALCVLVKRLAVDRLHIVGDIFDRGPHPDRILDMLMRHHAVDIEWGNHDILWMGAASGNEASIAAVVRNCLNYDNLDVLESGYGVSLRPLTLFAEKTYPGLPLREAQLQAIHVMMFKLEGQIILRHPEYHMEDRLLLDKLDLVRHEVRLDGNAYPVKEIPFPTLDPADPYTLSADEREVMNAFGHAFRHSERLSRHMDFLYEHGSMYRVFNNNLLFHGCIPMTEGGRFQAVDFAGVEYSGKTMMDHYDSLARAAYHRHVPSAVDFMWYLWCHPLSPVCGRHIKTFERVYVLDKSTWEEPQDPYYRHCETEEGCLRVLREFGLANDEAHVINGHTPIKVREGESPLKAGGKLVVIDGGFSRSFHQRTGIAGYTLIGNSHGLRLASHQPFTSIRDVLQKNTDIHSDSKVFFQYDQRFMISRTDTGKAIQKQIGLLQDLLDAYRSGWRPEA